mgnify:CR=1 FL=1
MATRKNKKKNNEGDSKNIKEMGIGIKELMLFSHEINSNDLIAMNHEELKGLIDLKLSEESFQVYRLDKGILNQPENTNLFLDEKLFKHSGNGKINCKVIYNETNQLKKLTKNKIRIIAWEELEQSNVSIELPNNLEDIECVINGNTFGCMDEWGFETFTEYSFTSSGKELDISLDSESYGDQKDKVVYLINANGDCGSIRDIDYNDNFGDEILDAFEELGLK